MNKNININGNATLNAAIEFLLSDELANAKKLVKRGDDTKKLVLDIVGSERAIDWKALANNDTVTVNGLIRFDAVEKNRFQQSEFAAMNPQVAEQFTKPSIEVHLKKL